MIPLQRKRIIKQVEIEFRCTNNGKKIKDMNMQQGNMVAQSRYDLFWFKAF